MKTQIEKPPFMLTNVTLKHYQCTGNLRSTELHEKDGVLILSITGFSLTRWFSVTPEYADKFINDRLSL